MGKRGPLDHRLTVDRSREVDDGDDLSRGEILLLGEVLRRDVESDIDDLRVVPFPDHEGFEGREHHPDRSTFQVELAGGLEDVLVLVRREGVRGGGRQGLELGRGREAGETDEDLEDGLTHGGETPGWWVVWGWGFSSPPHLVKPIITPWRNRFRPAKTKFDSKWGLKKGP